MCSTSSCRFLKTASLTDGLGNTVDFKNAIIIMTSNIGARHLQHREGSGLPVERGSMVSEKKAEDLVKNEVKRTLQPRVPEPAG